MSSGLRSQRFSCAGIVVALAACGLAGCGGGSSNPYEAAAEACVADINMDRATLGLPAYARWTAEEACVGGEASTDAASGVPHDAFVMDHQPCGESAQDECPGWPGPPETMIGQCLAQMWAEGPGTDFSTHGHYLNMSNKSYTMVACGFYVQADGSVWATQNFK
jgi:hypothetical protein